jgi:hypothetical protein
MALMERLEEILSSIFETDQNNKQHMLIAFLVLTHTIKSVLFVIGIVIFVMGVMINFGYVAYLKQEFLTVTRMITPLNE